MRTNIVINDSLLRDAMRLSGITTKKQVVEESLKLFVQLQKQKTMKRWFGKLSWQGNLETMRMD